MTSIVIEKEETNLEVKQTLTLEEFLKLPDIDASYELVEGEAIKKKSPKFFHSSLTTIFWVELSSWCDGFGRVRVEWSVVLKRRGKDWVPVPDLLYVSHERLAADWCEDAPCPVLPELVIEIVSPDQTFNQLAQKAMDYLSAGVDRVWVVYPPMRSLTVFFVDRPPETYRGDRLLADDLFPNLAVTSEQFFVKAGI
ncbi:Uma2 family endonuclease [Phormidium tenue]|jgi:Uma2 family endonuclease|uniref:Uma2 family endonuclease n=1 Tax=Phormidium tenue FACHB-1050 TaxID=2692857 RepID=A0ABR8C8L2_9CYAN|nr:Uma2 family endonuclease [Phormidium tenue]MBD2316603.1 Uma2 family endonuclease [Phormidium tenue FACHB-1050]